MEIGKRLQEERVNQGRSLEDIKNETKIQTRYLAAVEENDWSKMPGNFYVRAFIREYAEALGMDPFALLEEHKNELPQKEDTGQTYVTPSRASRGTKKSNPAIFSFLPKLLVFILVIGIIFGIWYSYVNYIHPALTDSDDENGSAEQEGLIAPNPEENDEEEESASDENDGESENETDGDESGEEESNEEDQDPSIEVEEVDEDAATPLTTVRLQNADTLEFEFEVDGETYLWVRGLADGEVQESYLEQMVNSDDSPVEVDASDSNHVELNIGYASAVTFTISGVEFEYEVDPQQEVHQKIHILWDQEENSNDES